MNKEWLPLSLLILVLLLSAAIGCDSSAAGNGPASSPTESPAEQPSQTSSPVSALASVADVVDNVRPAVVYISVEYLQQSFFGNILSTKTGSGAIFSADGYILTNNHVVDGARNIEVLLPDDVNAYPAEIVGTDPLSDLAVIKIDADELPTVGFADTSQLRVGDWVVALGNALGLEGGPSVTVGIVSNLERAFPIGEIGQSEAAFYDVIQTDADINQGNSGGPLVNLAGDVVGVNTFVIASGVETAGFAVNATTARKVYEELIEHGRVVRPYLGVQLRTVTPALASQFDLPRKSGVVVSFVTEDSPAAEAGMQVKDVIVSLQGKPVTEAYEITRLLWQYEVGDTVTMTLWRGNDERQVTVTLGERPT